MGLPTLSKICVEPEPEYLAVYNHVLKLESFNRLADQPGNTAANGYTDRRQDTGAPDEN